MPCWGERATEKKQLFCPAKVVLLDYNCGMIFCWQRLRITNAEYHDWPRNIQCGSGAKCPMRITANESATHFYLLFKSAAHEQ